MHRTTDSTSKHEAARKRELRAAILAQRKPRDPWSGDPDRTTRHYATSVAPGGHR